MNVTAFEDQRAGQWERLDALLARAGGRPQRLPSAEVRELGELYRAAAADLAFARRRFPHEPVRSRLEQLVKRARACVYAFESRRWSLVEFVRRGYWERVTERPGLLAVATALLLVPLALGAAWGMTDPGAAIGIVPEEFRAAAEPEGGRPALTADEEAAFSAQVFTNNIQVTFLAFALGITLGIGTAALLIYNGLFIGVVLGIAIESGQGTDVVALVTGHGVLELSCIAVAAAAGLRMGWALVDPGPRRRALALATEARSSLEIVLGTAAWLVVAGLAEGFVSGSVDTGGAVAIGIGLGALFWALILALGRPGRGEPQGEAEAEEMALEAADLPRRSPAPLRAAP